MGDQLDMGMKCIKYMLLTVNLMFVLTAALIISVGTTIYAIYDDFQHFINDGFYSPTSLLIAIGIIMLGISLFGCLGAVKESTCMINVFALLLSIVFVMEIAAAIAAYSLHSGIYEMVNEKMTTARNEYNLGGEATEAMDFLQSRLTCCGIENPDDWEGFINSTKYQIHDNFTILLPKSCCSLYNNNPHINITQPCTTNISYINGCMPRLIYFISQSAILLGTGALSIAFIQFIGIIFAIMLAKAIRRAKSDRERRRYQIREEIVNNYTQMEPHQGKKIADPTPIVYVPHIGSSQS